MLLWFSSAGSLLLLLYPVLYYRSLRCPLCCLSLLSYYRLFSMHLLYYSFVLLLASSFLLQSTTFCSSQPYGSAHHTIPIHHHTIPPVNSTPTSTVPLSPPPCCLRAHAHFASLASFVCSSLRRTTVCRMLSGCRPISAGCRSSVSGGRGRFQPASELSSGQRQCCDIRRRIESQMC